MVTSVAIGARLHPGATPKPFIYKPFKFSSKLHTTPETMNDTPESVTNQPTPVSELVNDPFAFLATLADYDNTTGILTQVELGTHLDRTESPIRVIVKAVEKLLPQFGMKVDGKVTARGVEVVKACFARPASMTHEAWIMGFSVLLNGSHQHLSGNPEPAKGAMDTDFLDARLGQIQANSTALALRGTTELQTLLSQLGVVESKLGDLQSAEIQQAEDLGYEQEMGRLTASVRGKLKAQQDFLASLSQPVAPTESDPA